MNSSRLVHIFSSAVCVSLALFLISSCSVGTKTVSKAMSKVSLFMSRRRWPGSWSL